MKQEKSCGAVLFLPAEGSRCYLVLKSVKGHSTLCKGHVEENETEEETARREIREETGLTAEFLPGFRHVITYAPFPGCIKDVVFFLGRVTGGVLTCQPEEVAEAGFYCYGEALDLLTHASDRETLIAAEEFLSTR